MCKAFCVLEEIAKDVVMGMALAGLDDDNLWNDLELTDVEELSFNSFHLLHLKFELEVNFSNYRFRHGPSFCFSFCFYHMFIPTSVVVFIIISSA